MLLVAYFEQRVLQTTWQPGGAFRLERYHRARQIRSGSMAI